MPLSGPPFAVVRKLHHGLPLMRDGVGYLEEVTMRNRPYAAYALMIATHLSLFAGAAALGRRLQRPLPRDFSVGDLMALGFATFRLSRLVTYERVTTVQRLPFVDPNRGPTHPEGTRGMPRGQGLQLALGQLFT